MYKIIVSDQAWEDIKSINKYIKIALKNPKAAKDLTIKFRDAIGKLDIFPERYQEVLINNTLIRRIPVEKYNIYYQVEKDTEIVSIARILYGGVDINQVALS